MSDFKAKMHQIRFPLRLCPRPRWGSLQRSPRGSLQRSPDPLYLRGPTSKGTEGKGEGREGEGEKGKGTGGEGCLPIGEFGSASELVYRSLGKQRRKMKYDINGDISDWKHLDNEGLTWITN